MASLSPVGLTLGVEAQVCFFILKERVGLVLLLLNSVSPGTRFICTTQPKVSFYIFSGKEAKLVSCYNGRGDSFRDE